MPQSHFARLARVVAVAVLASLSAAAGAAPPAGDQIRGARVYRQFCQHCHGPNLVNPGTVSFDLRRLRAEDYPRFSESVMNGKGNMPPWKATLKEGDLDALWAYITTARGG
ncbi:c-type cytochrome [Pseudoduganella namucuonensis]|uniref:Cytochrome c, mono-and diheme variants n=1 Tax=Pseudoduganella namucuonensis TaxID=1035707 RepID=A0A1I7F6Q7_9BURK|nr:cytochrome c [Pseudoduganella namucuonensis]SFU31863.1 Cytochrome c, mono-and diheme variants [Pseudoduganella namucuonensis]